MAKTLRVISINYDFRDPRVKNDRIDSDTALFDFDVVVIRPPQFVSASGNQGTFLALESMMAAKAQEVNTLFQQGGVLVVFLDVADEYKATFYERWGANVRRLTNYDFLDTGLADCLRRGAGTQVSYADDAEPFVKVLKKSTVAWTAYLYRFPNSFLKNLKIFAMAGKAGAVAGKIAHREGHLVLLPLITSLDEKEFLEVCAEYRFKRQGTPPPAWTATISVPGLPPIESKISALDKQIADLQSTRVSLQQEVESFAAYRKLLYEKGKTQLEPIVRRALDDLEFGTMPGEVIASTNYEIDGRTTQGSIPGILEVKGSKNVVVQSEFTPLVTKLLADSEITNKVSKGILVGNGLCESLPVNRLGDKVFSPHVLDGAKRHSVALVNSVELFWLCCTLLQGEGVDKNAVREAILTGNGYIDLKPFCATTSPFPVTS